MHDPAFADTDPCVEFGYQNTTTSGGRLRALMIAARLLAFSVLLTAVATGGTSAQTAVPQTATPVSSASPTSEANVAMQDLAFVPKVVRVHVGTTVVWTNHDDVPHTVTSGTTTDAGTWKSSALLAYGKTFRVRFDRIGTFAYYCKPHSYSENMHGMVIVTAP